ncbi:MAG: ribosomal RNA small subunit methyltransferase A [Candidatus Diapherotrites archaeon]|nr:ribosomal RNA small subunit methyltransferase A [Candidatus Diapherotrites archaeon]
MDSLSKELQKLMIEYFFSPKKKLDQNYLISKKAIRKLVDTADINKNDTILEIGPGCGFLTTEIVSRAKKTIAVEKDPLMVKILKDKFKNEKNLEIIEGDILKTKLPKFNKVVSSPPFSISSKIVELTLEHPVEQAVFLFQKEFVNKLDAFSSLKDYTFISALAQSLSKVKIIQKVPKSAFFPPPPIDCAIVSFDCTKQLTKEKAFHKKFLKAAFRHKNKKIKKALLHSASDRSAQKGSFLSKAQLKKVFENKTGDKNIKTLLEKKAVHCEPEELAKLSDFLFKQIKK